MQTKIYQFPGGDWGVKCYNWFGLFKGYLWYDTDSTLMYVEKKNDMIYNFCRYTKDQAEALKSLYDEAYK